MYKIQKHLFEGAFFIVILYLAILVTPSSSSNTNQVITIQPGASVQEVSELLYEKGIIKYPKRFILATKIIGIKGFTIGA